MLIEMAGASPNSSREIIRIIGPDSISAILPLFGSLNLYLDQLGGNIEMEYLLYIRDRCLLLVREQQTWQYTHIDISSEHK